MIHQGDIVITLFPYSNLSDAKLRPALVVSNDTVNQSGDFIAVAISSAARDPHTVPIRDTDFIDGAIHHNSFIHSDKIHRIDGVRYRGTIGKISFELLDAVIQKIHDYLRIEKK